MVINKLSGTAGHPKDFQGPRLEAGTSDGAAGQCQPRDRSTRRAAEPAWPGSVGFVETCASRYMMAGMAGPVFLRK